MSGKRTRFCWDSCVFISLLTKNGRSAEQLHDLQALAELVDNGDVEIFTPSITVIEVLSCYLKPEEEEMFQGLLNRSNIEVLSVTRKVSERAREIRDCYQRSGMKVAVPDSIQLAMASFYECGALHTYDGCGKRQKKTDLLKLPRPIIGKYDFDICVPKPPREEIAREVERTLIETQDMSLFDNLPEEVEASET